MSSFLPDASHLDRFGPESAGMFQYIPVTRKKGKSFKLRCCDVKRVKVVKLSRPPMFNVKVESCNCDVKRDRKSCVWNSPHVLDERSNFLQRNLLASQAGHDIVIHL